MLLSSHPLHDWSESTSICDRVPAIDAQPVAQPDGPICGFNLASVVPARRLPYSLGMRLEQRQGSIAAAIVYGAIAVYSAASLWFVLSGAFGLDDANRNALLSDARSMLIVWAIVCGFGIILAAFALRFPRLSGQSQRAILVASCGVAIIAGAWLEWWQSLYFLFPAFVLAMAFRRPAHA